MTEDAAACEREFLREFPCLDPTAFPDNEELRAVREYTFPGSRPVRFVEMPRSDSELLRTGSSCTRI